jgi:hypothetical protein
MVRFSSPIELRVAPVDCASRRDHGNFAAHAVADEDVGSANVFLNRIFDGVGHLADGIAGDAGGVAEAGEIERDRAGAVAKEGDHFIPLAGTAAKEVH